MVLFDFNKFVKEFNDAVSELEGIEHRKLVDQYVKALKSMRKSEKLKNQNTYMNSFFMNKMTRNSILGNKLTYPKVKNDPTFNILGYIDGEKIRIHRDRGSGGGLLRNSKESSHR